MADPLLSQYGWGAAATLAKRRNPAPQSAATTALQQQSAARAQPYAQYGLGAAGTAAKPQIGSALGPINSPAPSAPAGNPYDYSTDPALQAIKAVTARQRADARAGNTAGLKQLAIRFGDASGLIDDEGTALAAKGNPFSTLAEILRGYTRGVEGIDEGYNKRNLFFSGRRARALTDALEDRNRQEYRARNEVQDQVGALARALRDTLAGADMSDIEAEQGARDRAVQRSLDYGIDPGQGQPVTPLAAALAPATTAEERLRRGREQRLFAEGY